VGTTAWTTAPPISALAGGPTGEVLTASSNGMFINSSAGVGLLWASPFGPLRFDFAFPLTKQPYDRKQWFRFGGGTTF
jgi:outer membrane protein insertion porin family